MNRSTILYIRTYTFVQHEECRYDGVQQYHYTESTIPVSDRTALYVEYGDVLHGRTNALGVQQDAMLSTVDGCTRLCSAMECMQVRVRTT